MTAAKRQQRSRARRLPADSYVMSFPPWTEADEANFAALFGPSGFQTPDAEDDDED